MRDQRQGLQVTSHLYDGGALPRLIPQQLPVSLHNMTKIRGLHVSSSQARDKQSESQCQGTCRHGVRLRARGGIPSRPWAMIASNIDLSVGGMFTFASSIRTSSPSFHRKTSIATMSGRVSEPGDRVLQMRVAANLCASPFRWASVTLLRPIRSSVGSMGCAGSDCTSPLFIRVHWSTKMYYII